MELFSYPGETTSFSSCTASKVSETTESETMTDEISYQNRGMNTRPLKSIETQVELRAHTGKDSGDILPFLEKVEPLMVKELLKTTKAFQCNF